jgi:hypothetical protein
MTETAAERRRRETACDPRGLGALDVAREHLSEVERPVENARIAHVGPVDDKLGVFDWCAQEVEWCARASVCRR